MKQAIRLGAPFAGAGRQACGSVGPATLRLIVISLALLIAAVFALDRW